VRVKYRMQIFMRFITTKKKLQKKPNKKIEPLHFTAEFRV
jgi:hypothetical protein